MKKRDIGFLIFMLVVCFAAISATLVVNGNFLIAGNEEDFSVYFSEAIIDNVNKTNSAIGDNKRTLNFDTKELIMVGDSSTLEYEVTNNSSQYDAEVKINCTASSPEILNYVTLENTIDKEIIPAKSKANGTLKAVLTAGYPDSASTNIECAIKFDAISKDEINNNTVKANEYYTYGYILKNNAPVSNSIVLIKDANNAITKVPDERGMFIINSLGGGDYDIYVFEGVTESDLTGKTDEELISMSTDHSTFNTSDETINLTNYENSNSKVKAGTPITHTLTINPNGGVGPTITSTIIEGEPVGYLPGNIEHNTLLFNNWQNNDTVVDNNTVFNEDTTINATFREGVAKIGEKNFDTLNDAFSYVTTENPTTIEVIKTNSLKGNITTDKNIILNLNEKSVTFNRDYITTSGNLTIKNGIVESTGNNILINSGTLNLIDNFSIKHDNNFVEEEEIKLILNGSTGTLNISDANITASSPGRKGIPENCIRNEGTADISNTKIYITDMEICNLTSSVMSINNSSISSAKDENTGRSATVFNYGTITFNDTDIAYREENKNGARLISSYKGSTLNINSGTFDDTYGTENSIETGIETTFNLGASDKTIELIGNNSKYFTLFTHGDLNIVDGTINFSKGYGIGNFGKLTIGSSSTTPTINHSNSSYKFMDIKSNDDNRIINANINIDNTYAIDILKDNKLTIDNINLTLTNSTAHYRAISNSGNLIINNGLFKIKEDNVTSYGLIFNGSTGTLNINGGTFDNTYGKAESILTSTGSTMNIGAKDKVINFIGNNGDKYTVAFEGFTYIIDGTINFSNGSGIGAFNKFTIGTSSTTPTINFINGGGYDLMSVRTTTDSRIINANMNIDNSYAMNIYDNGILTIENINLIQSNSTIATRAIGVSGQLTIENGTFKIGETNTTSSGLLTVKEGANVNINGGTFDNTYGKSNSIYTNSGSTLNMGAKDKTIDIIGNNTGSYTLCHYGPLNIIDGTINFSKGYSIGTFSKITIGTETTSPTLNQGNSAGNLVQIRSNVDNRIINANINIDNIYSINVYKDNKLTIDNVNLTISNSTATDWAIGVTGNLIINGGTFKVAETNQTSAGLIKVNSAATVTINGGTFDNTYGKGNAIRSFSGCRLNIGASDKNINFIGNSTNNYTILSQGNLNILDGTINFSNGYGINNGGLLTLGSDTTIPTINNQNKGYNFIDISSASENKIVNANLNIVDSYGIDILTNGKLIIDNINLIQNNSTVSTRAIISTGELTINDGTFKLDEANSKGYGLAEVRKGGTINISGGTFDNTYGKASSIYVVADGTLNIGATNKTANFIGNKSSSYTITDNGALNILDGTINFSNGFCIGEFGTLTVGTETTTPTINNTGYRFVNIRANTSSKIINGTINSTNAPAITVSASTKLTIENVNLNISSNITDRAIAITGELVVNGGTFKVSETNKSCYGLMDINKGGTVTINEGIFDGNNAIANIIYVFEGATININGGRIEGTNAEQPIIYVSKGSLTMTNGSVINNASGQTICNNGGTAIQTGGVSANNYGVTAQ